VPPTTGNDGDIYCDPLCRLNYQVPLFDPSYSGGANFETKNETKQQQQHNNLNNKKVKQQQK